MMNLCSCPLVLVGDVVIFYSSIELAQTVSHDTLGLVVVDVNKPLKVYRETYIDFVSIGDCVAINGLEENSFYEILDMKLYTGGYDV